MSFMVMISGAGATFHEYFGLAPAVGGIAMALLVMVTVSFGLNRLVDIIGVIGPVIVVLSIALGISAITKNPGGIAEGNALLPTLVLKKASPNWLFAAGSYVGFCMLWLASFMAAMGATASSRKEAAMGGALGAIAFSIAVIIVALGLLANIAEVNGTEIPSLYLAKNLHPILATGFSVIIFAGISTTAVPLLWTVVARFSKERSSRFTVLTIVLGILGTFVGLRVPFSTMGNIVYVINGYVGILLLVMMLVKTFTRKRLVPQTT